MEYVRLGKSNLMISRVAVGTTSLAGGDANSESSAALIKKAYDAGINFFDAAKTASGAESILGAAVSSVRKSVIIADKTTARTEDGVLQDAEESLSALQTDYIDLYQFETEDFIPERGGKDGVIRAFETLKAAGKILHIGIATQDLDVAKAAVQSGLFETLQFPFNMISSEKTLALVELCAANDMGFLAMQPLCGGVLRNIPLAFGFLHQYEEVVPLWGVQSAEELEQILYFKEHPPLVDDKFREEIENARLFFN